MSREWLGLTSAVLVTGMVAGMAWTGTYDLELLLSLWILGIIVVMLLFSPRYIRPRHLPLLTLVLVLGLVAFGVIVGLHALQLMG